MKPRTLIAALALLAGGCTLTPNYTPPAAPIPGAWPAGSVRAHDATAPAVPIPPWEEFARDPNLRAVIALSLEHNRDLRLAALNAERARSLYGIRRSELLPAVNAGASMSRQRNPADLSGTGNALISERFDVNLGVAAWEIDFFGRIRSLKDRALQEYFATEEAQRAAQVALVSSVARAYLALAADQESLTLAKTTFETQQSALDLIQRRFELGLVPEIEVHRARTQVESARRDMAHFTEIVAQDQNALNLLAGMPVPQELLPGSLASASETKELQPGLPSDVLLRRPDVLQAENLLKAANADIGAARAAFFPRISLTAAFGTASSDLSGLFASGSSAWSYAPQIVMPIFDARTWSAHRAARVQQEMAVVEYERAIQVAFREVADALAALENSRAQVAAQESLVEAAEKTYELSQARFERGLDSYLSVLDAQRSLYAAEQALVTLRLVKAANAVQLFAVLGGGVESDQVTETRGGHVSHQPGLKSNE